jgi:hypothetical protein
MFETNIGENVCPLCKNTFYLEEGVVCKTFCGEENICSPPEEGFKGSECKTYYFCSENCAQEFEKSTPTCVYMPGWKKMMANIERVGRSTGLKGARPHHLHKSSK